jgi:hypothetical protein
VAARRGDLDGVADVVSAGLPNRLGAPLRQPFKQLTEVSPKLLVRLEGSAESSLEDGLIMDRGRDGTKSLLGTVSEPRRPE